VDIPHLIAAFRSLPPAAQLETLVRLAWELTIAGRDTYDPSSQELRHPGRLRALNEVQHRVTAHMLALLTDDAGRYPDEVLAAIVLEQDDPELRRQVAAAFARSLSSHTVA
jgi:hypothetical protein